MVMVPALGVPVGSPITDSSAVWTPPIVGPHDGAHLWLAHAMRGTSGPVMSLPDMIGGIPLVSPNSANGFVDDASRPAVRVNQGQDAMKAEIGAAAAITALAVVNLDPVEWGQVRVPGFTFGGNAASRFEVTGVNSSKVAFGELPAGWHCLVVRFNGSQVSGWLDGVSQGSARDFTPSGSTQANVGSLFWTSEVPEFYGALKLWKRALSDDEVAAASVDAMRLFGIR